MKLFRPWSFGRTVELWLVNPVARQIRPAAVLIFCYRRRRPGPVMQPVCTANPFASQIVGSE